MAKFPRVKGEEVRRALERAGFRLAHSHRSTHYYKKHAHQGLVAVPTHLDKILPATTLRSILWQANLTLEEFLELHES
jgi:predicted RNA binding protein YcfA (HicA-like mRNA interferase family)